MLSGARDFLDVNTLAVIAAQTAAVGTRLRLNELRVARILRNRGER